MIEELKPLIGKLTIFAKDRMGFEHPPRLFLRKDTENSQKMLGNTAYYDPQEKAVTLYTHNRHPKDILRSYAHELVHHTQNLRGDLSPEKCGEMATGYAQKDKHMREMEREAYEKGNMCFRDWEDTLSDKDNYIIMKIAESKILKENKTMTKKITKEFLKETIKRILAEETYTVRRGDYLIKIAKKFNTSVAAIAAANGIEDINRIDVGQKLIIPGGEPDVGTASAEDIEAIQSGELEDMMHNTIKSTTGFDSDAGAMSGQVAMGDVQVHDQGLKKLKGVVANKRKARESQLDKLELRGASDPATMKRIERLKRGIARFDAMLAGNDEALIKWGQRNSKLSSELQGIMASLKLDEPDMKKMVAPKDPPRRDLEEADAFAPSHYCVHHGGVQHEGKIVAAEAVQHNYNEKLGKVTHYDMKLPDGTILENIAAEDIQVTNATLAEGHGGHKMKKDDELEEEASKPDFIDIDGDGDKEESMKKASKDMKKEYKIQTPEQENSLYESRFAERNNKLFENLTKKWTK